MTQTPTVPQIVVPEKIASRTLLAGVALSSFAALLLELGLTRLFSVVLFYHFAFLAISIALLGLGAGGVFAYLAKNWLSRFHTRQLAAILCALNAMAVPAVLVIVLHSVVSLQLSWANFFRLTVVYLASAVPFFITGVEFSIVFAREPEHIHRLYWADLVGRRAGMPGYRSPAQLLGRTQHICFLPRSWPSQPLQCGRYRAAGAGWLPASGWSWCW